MDLISAKLAFFILMIFSVSLEVAGDTLLKQWSIENRNALLIFGLAIYALATLLWAFSLKYEFLSKAISIFTVLNLVAVVLVGVIVFKEDLTLINKLGIGLGILSVMLLEM
jgi:multidrug transporter EmrE-like cation transporter